MIRGSIWMSYAFISNENDSAIINLCFCILDHLFVTHGKDFLTSLGPSRLGTRHRQGRLLGLFIWLSSGCFSSLITPHIPHSLLAKVPHVDPSQIRSGSVLSSTCWGGGGASSRRSQWVSVGAPQILQLLRVRLCPNIILKLSQCSATSSGFS